MNNRLPFISQDIKVCIICEGNEEYEYLKKIDSLEVWHQKYKFFPVNAGGNGNIPARYQDRFQNDSYDVVLVFCDTEKKPHEQYREIKSKINDYHDVMDIAREVIIYANPCTMQIILAHWTDKKLSSPAKGTNASIVEECTGVKNYKARADQLRLIMEQITRVNYQSMYERAKLFPDDDEIAGSSNFVKFIDFFSAEDAKWICNINKKIEGSLSATGDCTGEESRMFIQQFEADTGDYTKEKYNQDDMSLDEIDFLLGNQK